MKQWAEIAKEQVLSIYPNASIIYHDTGRCRVSSSGFNTGIWESASSHWDDDEDMAWHNSAFHIHQQFLRKISGS